MGRYALESCSSQKRLYFYWLESMNQLESRKSRVLNKELAVEPVNILDQPIENAKPGWLNSVTSGKRGFNIYQVPGLIA